jgi:hypothetical protein
VVEGVPGLGRGGEGQLGHGLLRGAGEGKGVSVEGRGGCG